MTLADVSMYFFSGSIFGVKPLETNQMTPTESMRERNTRFPARCPGALNFTAIC